MQPTKEKIKEIKQSFRQYMNGVVSASMRQKGANYKINWGVSLAHLQEMAKSYGKDEELAHELWKENIRECKILATMIMPPTSMNKEMTTEWVTQIHTQEIAELAAFHLFQHVEGIEHWALDWLEIDYPLVRICAYHILSSLFKQSLKMDENSDQRFLNHVSQSFKSDHAGERHAAMNALNHYADIDEKHDQKAQKLYCF